MNKTTKVKEWLETGATISSMEAFQELGATRLSAIIFELRHCYGMDIVNIPCEGRDRFGNPTRYVRYRLVRPENMI